MPDLSLFGMRVVSNSLIEPVPVLQIRNDVPCSEPTRSKVNAYLLETFGTKEVAYVFGGDPRTVVMNPRMVAMLRAQLYDSLIWRPPHG